MTGKPYHLISIAALLLLSYFLSLLMVHTQLAARQQHRKFWNSLLLIFFLSTSLLGLLLVIKVNYKLSITWIEEAMQWHVNSGIGFALVALFHFLWHLRYFTRRQTPPSGSTSDPEIPWRPYLSFTPLQEKVFFMLLGYISIMAQLVLLREFIKSFHGNELVIGIFLAIWMLLTALGARTGNSFRVRIAPRRIYGLMVLMGGLPLLVHILLILVNRFFFLPGYQPGLLDLTICMVVLTALFTGISGFLFGFVSKSQGTRSSGSSYYRLDALGSLAGGVLFGLIMVHLLDNFQLLSLLFLTTSLVVMLVFKVPVRTGHRWGLILAGGVLLIVGLVPETGNIVEGLRYRHEKILQFRDTPYGNLTFTSRDEQVTGYLDGNPVASSSDLTGAEESVHFPALQHPEPKLILLLGGGLSGHIAEADKYQPVRIDYCEADPWIFRLGQSHFSENLPEELQFIPKDGRSWLMKSGDVQYDVVVSTAGNPVTIGWNRYFTREFYLMVRRHLSPGGVFCMQLSTAGNYVNDLGSKLLSINYHTLKSVFSHVTIVPGSATYYLASDTPLSLDFPAMLQQHQIPTTYVHPDYLDANHLQFDSDQLTDRILKEKPLINSDLRPRLFFASLTGLESQMGRHSLGITGIISAVIFLLLLLFYPPVKSAMYITGFTGAGIQIVLIMVMQSFYGFAYLVAPMMITLFMGGLVTGTVVWKKLFSKPSLPGLTGLVWIMALVSMCGLLLLKFDGLFNNRLSGQLILSLLNFIPGTVVGALFSMAVNINSDSSQNSPGSLYSADLTGAALGTLVPVVFLLPLIGMMNTFILFCGINVATALWLLVRGKEKER
ncbi:MAG: fused MFS/spermidine synthase [Bacteroidales bacterium]|nr:fused MFS/spermidine synthase [Bacteroidales bacterium]